MSAEREAKGHTALVRDLRNMLANMEHRAETAELALTAERCKAAALRDAVSATTASLIAAISLLQRGGKKAAPSNRMFAQMLADYQQAAEKGRAALTTSGSALTAERAKAAALVARSALADRVLRIVANAPTSLNDENTVVAFASTARQALDTDGAALAAAIEAVLATAPHEWPERIYALRRAWVTQTAGVPTSQQQR